jgi:hypothetical protein
MQEYGIYILSAYAVVFVGLIYITFRFMRFKDQ